MGLACGTGSGAASVSGKFAGPAAASWRASKPVIRHCGLLAGRMETQIAPLDSSQCGESADITSSVSRAVSRDVVSGPSPRNVGNASTNLSRIADFECFYSFFIFSASFFIYSVEIWACIGGATFGHLLTSEDKCGADSQSTWEINSIASSSLRWERPCMEFGSHSISFGVRFRGYGRPWGCNVAPTGGRNFSRDGSLESSS